MSSNPLSHLFLEHAGHAQQLTPPIQHLKKYLGRDVIREITYNSKWGFERPVNIQDTLVHYLSSQGRPGLLQIDDLFFIQLYGLEVNSFYFNEILCNGTCARAYFQQSRSFRRKYLAKGGHDLTGYIFVPEKVLTQGFFEGVHENGGKVNKSYIYPLKIK